MCPSLSFQSTTLEKKTPTMTPIKYLPCVILPLHFAYWSTVYHTLSGRMTPPKVVWSFARTRTRILLAIGVSGPPMALLSSVYWAFSVSVADILTLTATLIRSSSLYGSKGTESGGYRLNSNAHIITLCCAHVKVIQLTSNFSCVHLPAKN